MPKLINGEKYFQENKELSEKLIESLSKIDLKSIDIKSTGNNEFKVVMSIEIKDRDGDTIIVTGIDTSNFMKNPVLLNSHDYRGIENIIGKFTKVYIDTVDGVPAFIGEGLFAVGLNPVADIANNLYQNGFLKTVSVGFMNGIRADPNDRSKITSCQLLECSFVPVPSNPDALDQLNKAFGNKYEDVYSKIFENEEKKTKKQEITIEMLYNEVKGLTEKVSGVEKVLSEIVETKTEKDKIIEIKKEIQGIVNYLNEGLHNMKNKRI